MPAIKFPSMSSPAVDEVCCADRLRDSVKVMMVKIMVFMVY